MTRTRRILVTLGAAVLGALAIGGCSDDDDSKSKSGASQFIAEYCAVFMPCCEQAGMGSNPAQCQQILGAFSAALNFSAEQAQECLEQMRAASAEPDFCATGPTNAPACDTAFTSPGGTVPPGGECTTSGDCAEPANGTASCHFEYDAETGSSTSKCLVEMDGKQGDACIGTVEDGFTSHVADLSGVAEGYVCDMAKGLYCDRDELVCKPVAQLNEQCSFDHPCAIGTVCDFASSTCQKPAAVGEDCSATECEDGAYCDGDTNKCAPAKAGGEACDSSRECQSGSCLNQKCEAINGIAVGLFCGE